MLENPLRSWAIEHVKKGSEIQTQVTVNQPRQQILDSVKEEAPVNGECPGDPVVLQVSVKEEQHQLMANVQVIQQLQVSVRRKRSTS